MIVSPVATEAALKCLADENRRLLLLLAQAVGNLALANNRLRAAEALLAERLTDEQVDMAADGTTDQPAPHR